MTAFDTGLDKRDVFLGERRCVICGDPFQPSLQHCHIIGRKDTDMWALLKRLGWAPEEVKDSPEHESRNGLLMCSNHHLLFDNWAFFIRFQPSTQKYVLVHYDSCGKSRSLKPFHGKAVALDIKDPRAPLPLLFLVHEFMVLGRNFYQPTPIMLGTPKWQDWLLNDGVVNEDEHSFSFNREAPPSGPTSQPPANMQTSSYTNAPSGSQTVLAPPTDDLINELLAFQRTMPSWKACVKESQSWEGTAEENIKKYAMTVGVESAQ